MLKAPFTSASVRRFSFLIRPVVHIGPLLRNFEIFLNASCAVSARYGSRAVKACWRAGTAEASPIRPRAQAASRRTSSSMRSSCNAKINAGNAARFPICPREWAAALKTNGFCSGLLLGKPAVHQPLHRLSTDSPTRKTRFVARRQWRWAKSPTLQR